MLVPLAVLAVGAVFAGVAFAKYFIGHDFDEFWKGALGKGPNNHIMHDMHEIPHWVGFAPFVMMLIGFIGAWWVYIARPGSAQRIAAANPVLYRFFLNKWYFDELYNVLFVKPAFWVGRLFWKGGDGAIIDRLGPDGIANRVLYAARNIAALQTGYLYHYAFAMLMGVAAFITYYLFAGAH
jgi:NADH-quinone oxidoreductase subunit L